MVKRAVLIGINYFGTDSELRGCIKDISNIYKFLSGYEVTILHDGKRSDFPEGGSPILPTDANIRAALKSVMRKSKPGDRVYVHYSGHGSQLPDQNGDEYDGQDECICPVNFDFKKKDAGFIRDDELNQILSKPGVILTAIFDCCHSGSALDFPYRWAGSQFAIEKAPKDGMVGFFISGCRDDQTSADAVIDDLPSGALTWAVIKAMGELKKSKLSYTWREFIELIRFKLKKGGYEQIPQLCLCRKEDLNATVSW